jgi:hypothetical protein
MLAQGITGSMFVAALAFATMSAAAADPSYISGEAANAAFTTYQKLAAQKAIELVGRRSQLAVRIDEDATTFFVEFRDVTRGDPAPTDALRTTRNPNIGVTHLTDGSKTLSALQTTALLLAMDFAHQHPMNSESVRRYAAEGYYTLMVTDNRDPRYTYVGVSYPGSPALGITSIACPPLRSFRYDPRLNTITEVQPPCG